MTERAATFFIDIPPTFCHNQINDYVTKACGIMLKRWLSLVLAMTLFFTSAVPVVLAEETYEAHVQALLDALLKDLESQLPQTEYKENPTPTSASVNAVSIEKDAVTLKDGESITENISSADAEFYRYSFKTPAPVDDPIATVELSATTRTSANSNWVSGSTGLYLDYTVHAHKPGSVILNFSYTLEIDEQGTGSYFPVLERTYTLPVEVIPALNPPKVEVRLVPDSTVMQGTGVHKAVDFLDTALDLLDPIGIAGKVIEKIIPQSSKVVDAVTDTKKVVDAVREADSSIVATPQEQAKIDRGSKKYTTSRRVRLFYYTFKLNQKYQSLYLPFFPKASTIVRMLPTLLRFARNEILERSILWLLKQVKVPRLEPEVYLEVVVTNPDNTVPLYYDMNIDAPRVTHSSKDMIPITPGTPLQTTSDAYSEQVIHPGSAYRNVHRFKLEPEWVFNEANYDQQMSTSSSYTSGITVSGSWGEWKGIDGKEPGGSFAESVELNVISTLGPKSEYEKMDHFFSDAATNVFNVLEYVSQLSLSAQPANSDQAWVELLDSLPEGAALMTPVDHLPPSPVISAPGSNP